MVGARKIAQRLGLLRRRAEHLKQRMQANQARRSDWDAQEAAALRWAIEELELLGGLRSARPLDDWHEDHGPALWWKFPVMEAPYSGQPTDSDWPGYHTHWTPLLVPKEEA